MSSMSISPPLPSSPPLPPTSPLTAVRYKDRLQKLKLDLCLILTFPFALAIVMALPLLVASEFRTLPHGAVAAFIAVLLVGIPLLCVLRSKRLRQMLRDPLADVNRDAWTELDGFFDNLMGTFLILQAMQSSPLQGLVVNTTAVNDIVERVEQNYSDMAEHPYFNAHRAANAAAMNSITAMVLQYLSWRHQLLPACQDNRRLCRLRLYLYSLKFLGDLMILIIYFGLSVTFELGIRSLPEYVITTYIGFAAAIIELQMVRIMYNTVKQSSKTAPEEQAHSPAVAPFATNAVLPPIRSRLHSPS